MRRVLIALAIVIRSANTVTAEEVTGRHPTIIDGDTIVLGGMKWRLWGIDAPPRDVAVGVAATDALTQLIGDAAVTCTPILELQPSLRSHPFCPTDGTSYDRRVGRCSVAGADLSEQLVARGYAVDWPRFSCGAYAATMASAIVAGVGSWADGSLTPYLHRP